MRDGGSVPEDVPPRMSFRQADHPDYLMLRVNDGVTDPTQEEGFIANLAVRFRGDFLVNRFRARDRGGFVRVQLGQNFRF